MWRRVTDRLLDRRVSRLRRRTPSRPTALKAARRLIAQGRYEDADAVLEAALARWPGCATLVDRYAFSAQASGRHIIALARFEELRRVDPNSAFAWAGLASNQRSIEELGPAEATIREALVRFPDNAAVANEAARLFDRIGAQAEAVAQWSRLCAQEPVHEEWYQGYAFCLIMLGRVEEAEAALDRADAAYPGHQNLLSTRAYLEMEREDWNAALALWRRYRGRYPDDQTGWEGQGKTFAAIHAARAEAATVQTDAVKADIEVVEDDDRRTLMLGFESIGADCEFGLVQRRFGAEPLGLLRFNDVGLPNLMAALGETFEGMGELDRTEMVVSNSGEFYVTDTRWDLGMHTFMFASRHETATLLPKMCRRVVYLRDKLLADLRDAQKIFVFKTDAIDIDGLRALHCALHRFGAVRLLHVRRVSVPLADRSFDVIPGQVVLLAPNLYIGFLSRMGNAGFDWDIAFDEWVSICSGIGEARALPGLSI